MRHLVQDLVIKGSRKTQAVSSAAKEIPQGVCGHWIDFESLQEELSGQSARKMQVLGTVLALVPWQDFNFLKTVEDLQTSTARLEVIHSG